MSGGDEVKRLQGLIKKVDEEIANLVNKKKIFQEQLNKLISEKHYRIFDRRGICFNWIWIIL